MECGSRCRVCPPRRRGPSPAATVPAPPPPHIQTEFQSPLRPLGLTVERAVKAGWERGVAAAGAPCSPAGVSPRPEHIASTAAGDVRGFPNGHVGRDARPPRVPGLPLHTHSGGWGPAPRTPRPPPGKRVGCPPGFLGTGISTGVDGCFTQSESLAALQLLWLYRCCAAGRTCGVRLPRGGPPRPGTLTSERLSRERPTPRARIRAPWRTPCKAVPTEPRCVTLGK